LLLALLAAPAAAQAPVPAGPYDAELPAPDVAENASPAVLLQAARGAIAAGRLPEAMEALEQAQTRALIRSVRPSLVNRPSRQPQVERIAAARAALAGGDRMRALELIEQALAAEAKEPE
jgi:hypothetical protein